MRKVLCFLFLVLCVTVRAQDDPEYRMEVGAGLGVMNYLGDYNEKLLKGFQPSASVLCRVLFNPSSAMRFSATYGKLKGRSLDEDTYYPNLSGDVMTRDDYQFNTTLVDVSSVYEYNFWPYGTGRDVRGAKRLTPYIYIGLGLTYAKCDAVDKGSFAANLPLGIGVKYKVADRVNLGVRYGFHFTTGDELDGRKYPYGIKSNGLFKNTDSFSSLEFSITYSFAPKCRTCNRDEW